MLSAVTPGYVGPPLSPVNFGMHRGDDVVTFSWSAAPDAHRPVSPSRGRPRASTFWAAVATPAAAVRVAVAAAVLPPPARADWPLAPGAAEPTGPLLPVARAAPDATGPPAVASAARSSPGAGAALAGPAASVLTVDDPDREITTNCSRTIAAYGASRTAHVCTGRERCSPAIAPPPQGVLLSLTLAS